MSQIVFSAEDLTKKYLNKSSYHMVSALNHFNMEIRKGEIYGFIGENGAGKTTLMRILTGRITQYGGKITLFGKETENEICVHRGNIGALIERPAFYSGMTAGDNLKTICIQRGWCDDMIDTTLDMVGLLDVKDKKVKDFSLGMKQRMGIAIALLGEPEFLVLDEPINGLDPEGIMEFRDIIKEVNKEKKTTVLISSHILSELEQLATCFGFIHNGKMVEEISESELRARLKPCIIIQVDNVMQAKKVLNDVYVDCIIKRITKYQVQIYGFEGDTKQIEKILETNDIYVKDIKLESGSLENYYMTLVGGSN